MSMNLIELVNEMPFRCLFLKNRAKTFTVGLHHRTLHDLSDLRVKWSPKRRLRNMKTLYKYICFQHPDFWISIVANLQYYLNPKSGELSGACCRYKLPSLVFLKKEKKKVFFKILLVELIFSSCSQSKPKTYPERGSSATKARMWICFSNVLSALIREMSTCLSPAFWICNYLMCGGTALPSLSGVRLSQSISQLNGYEH